MTQARRIATPLGPVVIEGRDTGRPPFLLITGAFAEIDMLDYLQPLIPERDFWRAHLPGNHCPPLLATSIGAFGAAFSHALGQVLGDRRADIMGLSTGALAALAIDAAHISRLTLVEPPLRPTLAWPLRQFAAVTLPPGGEAFVRAVFGIGRTDAEPRDYTGLLARLARPTMVLLGGIPLEPERPLAGWPSLVDVQSRRDLAAHPQVRRLEVFETAGHNVPAADAARFHRLVQAATGR